jgi:AraC-like DNA-binding protein
MRQVKQHQSAGLKAQPPHYEFRTRSYEQFQLIYVMNGVLLFETQGDTKSLESDTALVLRESSAFRLFTRDRGYDGVCYVSSGEREPAFRGEAVSFPAPPPMRALARLMQAEGKAPAKGSRDVLLGLGRALAWQAIRFSEKSREAADGQDYGRLCAERAREALDVAIYTGQRSREILAGMSLSYRQLSRYFQAAFGLSPKQYQLQARLREAQQLLRNTALPVTAVAMELGFASSQHFATQFAALAGCSPSAWRAEKK